VRLFRDATEPCPTVEFASGDADVEAVVFPRDGIRQSPFGPVDGRPMRRATRQEVEALLDEAGPEGGTAPLRGPYR
jgi:hypothetical protein